MAQHQMNKTDLAEAAHLGISTIKRLLDVRDHDVNLATLVAVARVFNVKVSDLLDE